MKFKADKIKISGPKVDGSYTVTFEVGEYEQQIVAQLMLIPQNTIIEVEVKSEKSE